MKFIPKIISLIGIISLCSFFIYAVNYPEKTTNIQKNSGLNDYNIYAIDMPENLNFAGEKVPVEINDIKERMDRELLVNTYWQSNGLLLIKRAHKYFPIIEPILKQYGIPNDFKYLAVIESGLTQAVSRANAVGFWQILKNTGRELGLEVNSNVDERYHIEKSTHAACKYLLKSKEKFGSWTLSAAAYNAGNTGIQNKLNKQNVNSYYDLLLGQETGRYVFRIIAIKQILKNPKAHGFNYKKRHLYTLSPTYNIPVDTVVTNFTNFANKYGITYKDLKLYNPWLRQNKLNNASRKNYLIKIPKQKISPKTK